MVLWLFDHVDCNIYIRTCLTIRFYSIVIMMNQSQLWGSLKVLIDLVDRLKHNVYIQSCQLRKQ